MWRRAAFLSLLAWLLAVGVWANSSWTESIPLVTPPGIEGESRTFVCGAPLGARTVRAREPVEQGYPLVREPCDHHDERRTLAVFDLVLGVTGLVVLAYFGTRHVAGAEPEPVAPVG